MTQNGNALYLKPALLSLEVDDEGKDFASVINEASFRINLKPSSELLELFNRYNFTRRGEFTWSHSINEENVGEALRFIRNYSENFTPCTLYGHETKAFENSINVFFQRMTMRDSSSRSAQPMIVNNSGNFFGVPSPLAVGLNNVSGGRISDMIPEVKTDFNDIRTIVRGVTYGATLYPNELQKITPELKRELSPARLFLYIKRNTLYVTMKIVGNLVGFDSGNGGYGRENPELVETVADSLTKKINAPGVRTYVSENYYSRWEIRKALDTLDQLFLTEEAWDLEQSKRAFDLLDEAESKVTVGYAPGKPAQAIMYRGSGVPTLRQCRIAVKTPRELTVKKVLEAQTANPDVEFVIHPSLLDIVSMNKAEPFEDEKLHDYQKIAVGLHLSSDIGYLNASDPGLGKSIMLLAAMRERAKTRKFYRGLIVSEANVRQQWKEYAEEWFPEAEVFVLTNASQVDKLMSALSSTQPLIVVTSYALAAHVYAYEESEREMMEKFVSLPHSEKKHFFSSMSDEELSVGEILYNSYWNDICADEAVCIRNGNSKQAKAMWILRHRSDVAVALTGTPVNKGADDMAKLLEWVRNDKRLFQGHKLSKEYDTESLKGATKLFQDLTPLIFRRERNEVKAETDKKSQKLPKMKDPVSILLKPTSSEKALAYAAEKELKRVYLELMSALEAVEGEDNAEALKEAKEQLRDAHGQWLGGTQLARMATSDPASLMKSDSMGASLLVGQGLVASALEDEPTKRVEFIKRAQGHIKKGQSIIVFTDFTTVADSLVEALEENGIRAGSFTGKNLKKREQNRKDFQDGKMDVLVCTKAAERGLTLHKASAIYHYDMPWTVERLTQRIGRALRVGSENREVEVFFMLLEGTVEERVAAQVLSQGTTASMILDASRGVDVSKTGLGSTMAGLMSTSKSLASRKGALEFGKALNLV